MRINQTTIERLAWWVVFLILLLNIAIYAKLTRDDDRKFKVLKNNQNTILCITKGFTEPNPKPTFIDDCVKANQ